MPESPYRQMELSPRTADGEMHTPEQMRQQMEHARRQAAYYEQQSKDLAESSEQKILFNDSLNDLGMRLHNATRRLTKEYESMKAEAEEVEIAYKCLSRHLEILSSLQPQTWSPEGFAARLNDAILKLERAENDFNEVFRGGHKYLHTDVFRFKPGEPERKRFGWAKLREKFLEGLAFHLPLFCLLLCTWLVYLLITRI